MAKLLNDAKVQNLADEVIEGVFNICDGNLKDNKDINANVVTVAVALIESLRHFKVPAIPLKDVIAKLEYRSRKFADEYITEELWKEIRRLAHNYDFEVFQQALIKTKLDAKDGVITPERVTCLAAKLLDMENPDPECFLNVANFVSGKGNFAIDYNLLYPSENAIEAPSMEITSFETDYMKSAVGALRGAALTYKFPAECNRLLRFMNYDVFKLFMNERGAANKSKFDKIFAHYDWNRENDACIFKGDYCDEYVEQFIAEDRFGKAFRHVSVQWVTNHLMINMLNDSGKAVVVMHEDLMHNDGDKAMREMFVKNGWIEKVVKLPFNFTDACDGDYYMLVLSKGNEDIKFVDISQGCTKDSINIMSFDDVVLERLAEQCSQEYFAAVSSLVKEQDYNLDVEPFMETLHAAEDFIDEIDKVFQEEEDDEPCYEGEMYRILRERQKLRKQDAEKVSDKSYEDKIKYLRLQEEIASLKRQLAEKEYELWKMGR